MSMPRGVRLAVSLIALLALQAMPLLGGQAPRVIQIEAGDNMKFSVTSITARPGERLQVVLKDIGRMPKVAMAHNFVLLKKGVNPKEFVDKCANARATDFIAPEVKGQVLAATRMLGPGETGDVSFAAPTQPGQYTYLCSFPGHYVLGMKGVLTVK